MVRRDIAREEQVRRVAVSRGQAGEDLIDMLERRITLGPPPAVPSVRLRDPMGHAGERAGRALLRQHGEGAVELAERVAGPPPQWARLIAKVSEVEPLHCACGAPG